MPVAEFTLDRRFDFQAIEAASVLARELVKVHTKPPSPPVPLRDNVVDVAGTLAKKRASEKNSRKRALEADAFERPRLIKRARIYAPERPLRTPLKSSTSKRFLSRCTSSPIDGAPCSLSPVEGLQVVDRSFQREDDTTPLFAILPQPNILELQTYWEGQLDEQSRTGSVLSLRIEDILRAPGSHASLFRIGGECLGKQFRVIRDKTSARTCSPTDVSKTLIETPCTFNTRSKSDREEDYKIRNERIPSSRIRNSSGWLKLGKARNRFPVLIDN
ncbi:hypothetical protein JOM56_007836 [Amanita muscaria]